MADDSISTLGLLSEAYAAMSGDRGLNADEAQQVLVDTAKALARALPNREGPHMAPEEIRAAAINVRFFLRLVADLLGDPADPDCDGAGFAFAGTLKKRPGWKPSPERTDAEKKRMSAARRVYELMARQSYGTGRRPQQEAAVAAVMVEFSMARSKVMQGLKELRDFRGVWSPMPPDKDWDYYEAHPDKLRSLGHRSLMNYALEYERHRRELLAEAAEVRSQLITKIESLK